MTAAGFVAGFRPEWCPRIKTGESRGGMCKVSQAGGMNCRFEWPHGQPCNPLHSVFNSSQLYDLQVWGFRC